MYVPGTPSIRILGLLILHSQIDFNAVGAATNLKASAARMRYSRLRKNIETTLGESSRKALGGSTKAPAVKKVKTSTTVAKKRKISYDSEDDEHDLATLDEDIGNAVIKNEELQQWTAGRLRLSHSRPGVPGSQADRSSFRPGRSGTAQPRGVGSLVHGPL